MWSRLTTSKLSFFLVNRNERHLNSSSLPPHLTSLRKAGIFLVGGDQTSCSSLNSFSGQIALNQWRITSVDNSKWLVSLLMDRAGEARRGHPMPVWNVWAPWKTWSPSLIHILECPASSEAQASLTTIPWQPSSRERKLRPMKKSVWKPINYSFRQTALHCVDCCPPPNSCPPQNLKVWPYSEQSHCRGG